MNARQIHGQASLAIQEAIVAQAQGKEDTAQLFEKAFELEKQAALLLINDFDDEPFRSVLSRSAGSLAMNCKKYREAEKLIAQGLIGEPPQRIMHQLRALSLEINKHLYVEAEAEVA